jgi:dTMP kinase
VTGLYVTVEGIDGSGTTSVTERLGERLDCVTTAEPSTLWTGEVARNAFEVREVPALSRFHFFQADRAAHVADVVRPALELGSTVVCDRGPDSTRAYQSVTTDIPDDYIEETLSHTLSPDLTLWLDVDPSVAAERMDGADAFEDRDVQLRVAERYAEIAERFDRIVRIDANQPLDRVVDDAVFAIDTHGS